MNDQPIDKILEDKNARIKELEKEIAILNKKAIDYKFAKPIAFKITNLLFKKYDHKELVDVEKQINEIILDYLKIHFTSKENQENKILKTKLEKQIQGRIRDLEYNNKKILEIENTIWENYDLPIEVRRQILEMGKLSRNKNYTKIRKLKEKIK